MTTSNGQRFTGCASTETGIPVSPRRILDALPRALESSSVRGLENLGSTPNATGSSQNFAYRPACANVDMRRLAVLQTVEENL